MKRFLILIVALAGAVAAAAFAVPSNAATVNGASISTSQLNSDLSAIAGSTDYQCLLDAQIVVATDGSSSLPPIAGVASGTYNTSFVDYWLSHMINGRLVQQVASRHLPTLTAAQVATARSELEGQIDNTLSEVSGSAYECEVSAAAVLSSLPGSFVNELVRQQAWSDVLESQQPGAGVTTADLLRYFERHQSDFETQCVSAIVVSSKSTASSLRSQIENGTATFAQLANTDSLDKSSTADGGALGCFTPTSAEYASVREDTSGLGVGQVSKPLTGEEDEYALIQLTSVKPATFSAVRSVVRTAALASGRTRSNALLAKVARRSSISVNPSYGRWTAASAAKGVLPPLRPPVGSLLSPKANLPEFSGSTSSSSSATTSG